MNGEVIILTGARGVGKSTACLKTVTLARGRGYTCGGLITLRRFGDAREVLDLYSGTFRPLTALPGAAGKVVVQGQFHLLPGTLDWGNALFNDPPPRNLLVVDELGPLELEQQAGWWRGVEVLQRGDFALGVAVVRPELVAQVSALLPKSATVLIATPTNRDGLPRRLMAALEAAMKRHSGGAA